ncbi:MAG: NADH-quinone oxidoreductase subunit C [Bacillota bacterium]|jgi:ech hydrogenase subunit D
MADQQIINIEPDKLRDKVQEVWEKGYRLSHITCTKAEKLEMIYGFDLDYEFLNFKFEITKEEEIPSISDIYWSAFLYENEIHDLYGITIKGMAIDFQGNLYHTAVKTPFAENVKQK